MVAATDRAAVSFSLSGGEKNDSPEGEKLIGNTVRYAENIYLMADRAYCGKSFRKRAEEKGYKTVIPPKINYKESWEYDKEMYKGRNVVERLFLRMKRYRRIATRYEKLDIVFSGFICFVFIIDAILV